MGYLGPVAHGAQHPVAFGDTRGGVSGAGGHQNPLSPQTRAGKFPQVPRQGAVGSSPRDGTSSGHSSLLWHLAEGARPSPGTFCHFWVVFGLPKFGHPKRGHPKFLKLQPEPVEDIPAHGTRWHLKTLPTQTTPRWFILIFLGDFFIIYSYFLGFFCGRINIWCCLRGLNPILAIPQVLALPAGWTGIFSFLFPL